MQWRGLLASAVVRRGLLDSETGAGGASAAGRRPLAFSLLGGVLFLKIARIAAVRIKPAATELDRHRPDAQSAVLSQLLQRGSALVRLLPLGVPAGNVREFHAVHHKSSDRLRKIG